MENLRPLWIWMIAVMVIMQISIAMDYWGDFASNAWAVHIHYWNATVWYAFLILQPWFVAKGKFATHRTWGMFGLLLAGAMVLLSVSLLFRDIVNADAVRDNPQDWGPFEPWFFIWILLSELVLIIAFAIAVIMAIVKRKSPEDHGWWMASTAFTLIMPALGRGLQNVWIMAYGFVPENKAAMDVPLYICQATIIAMTLLFAWRFGKLRHPATVLAIGANLGMFALEPVSKMPAVQEFLRFYIAV
jgi:hypothetical protein